MSHQPPGVDAMALIDLDRYPLHQPDALEGVVESTRLALAEDGVAGLAGFLRQDALRAMCREAEALEPLGHHSTVSGTAFLGLPDLDAPVGHPRRVEVANSLTAIAYDRFPVDSPLRALYEAPELLQFLERVFDRGRLYRYADPLGALNIAAMRDGDELGWHFDMTDFVVSLALQSSEAGGEFESACRVRGADGEPFDEVAAILGGSRTGVSTIAMETGTLLLFEGRSSLHRVTPIVGAIPRYVALLAFDTRPGTDSTELLKSVRYGRTTPVVPPGAREAVSR